MRNRGFRIGEGTYICECCGRRTRDTMNSMGSYCEQCEELLMLQNSCFDGDYKPGEDAWGDKQRDKWIAIVEKRGGNVARVKQLCERIFP